MHPYEVMLMLDADADEARQNEVIERMRQIVEQGEGTFETVDAWGRLKLAYEIDHKGEAFYHIVNFTSSTETLDEVTRVLKITDGVMRHMATRRPKGGGRVAPPPQPVFEAEPAREVVANSEPEPERQAESADSEIGLEEYAEPTESEPAPVAAPEEGA